MDITIYLLLPKAFLIGAFLELGDEQTAPFFELNLGIIGIGFYPYRDEEGA